MNKPDSALAAASMMTRLGLDPDPWQIDVLRGQHKRLLLNCCRQAGKSTVVAIHALFEAMFSDDMLILLLSRSQRQSAELLRTIIRYHERIRSALKRRQTANELTFSNNSRILSLPCKEDTIRGYANVGLLIIDEAARVPDDLYKAVRPMLAVSRGRLICMSTPRGKRGFFYEAWARGGADWHRIEIRAQQVSRIDPEYLAQERRALSESTFRQEFECSFESVEGLVFPGLPGCAVPELPGELAAAFARGVRSASQLQRVGGIDFGYRNPFAAVWGILDQGGVLWLCGEHYDRQKPLSYHATQLPRQVTWYADPAGASERAELRCGGFTVRQGNNAIQNGIAAVNARIQHGRLKIVAGKCPNLLAEAGLYCYSDEPEDQGGEKPLDRYNHALAALRYLIATVDTGRMARDAGAAVKPLPKKPDPWLRFDNEELWTRF